MRNAAVSSMFDYAFANFSNKTMLKAGEDIGVRVAVSGGKKSDIGVCADRDLTRFVSREDTAKYDVKFDLPPVVKAPVKKGDSVGKAYLVKNGEVVDTAVLVANEDAERMSFFDAINEIAKEWNTAK